MSSRISCSEKVRCDEGKIHVGVAALAYADQATLCGIAGGLAEPTNRAVNCVSCIRIALDVLEKVKPK